MNNEIIEINSSSNELLRSKYENSLNIVEDIVFNNFVKDIEDFEVVPLEEKFDEELFDFETRIFKINKLVYSKDEDIYSKMTNILNTLYVSECSVYLILDSDGVNTNIYMGIRSNDPKREVSHIMNMFENSLKGQFPGSITENLDNDRKREIMKDIDSYNVAMSTSVPGIKDQNLDIQRLESFIESMRGKSYTAVILANNSVANEIDIIRSNYEEIYTGLSYLKDVNITKGTSESETIGNTLSVGINKSITENKSESLSKTKNESKTKMNTLGKVAMVLGGSIGMVGGPAGMGLGAAMGASLFGKQETKGTSESINSIKGSSYTEGNSESESKSTSSQSASNNSVALSVENKKIKNILGKIDLQFERLSEFENLGMWETASYFLSEDKEVAEMAASNYNSLMRGDRSGLENIAINSWYNSSEEKTLEINKYIKNFIHPKFYYEKNDEIMEVTGCSNISGNELSICMGLPRNSIVGLPIVEFASFGKEVAKLNEPTCDSSLFKIGCINSNGEDLEDISVKLDENSLSQHTFITGSTGTGKSNTVYKIIEEIEKKQIKYMIIEPAKGEYKNVFGNNRNVSVYGTNPSYVELLKINPFSFPKEIHVYEHIDRLIEIFKASWELYSAMPAILKDAVIASYESCGWNLETSISYTGEFPNFLDLERELKNSINKSGYSDEVKSNYKGALITRVSSMTNGLNNLIFQGKEIENKDLFDKNVIVDLSRIGSQETKSLIMGILIIKLNEYRMSTKENFNEKIKHVTVIEEAHNILPATTNSLSGTNISGKSVELISNSLAEMRTYGEGFIIVDQSPSSVDISAIKNTNTKIIMRLPEENDINIAGKSIGLDEEQIKEIIRLPMGTAVVYQNGWLEPVVCKIDKSSVNDKNIYKYNNKNKFEMDQKNYKEDILKFLIIDKIKIEEPKLEAIKLYINSVKMSSKDRIILNEMIVRYENAQINDFLNITGKDRCDIIANLIFDYNANNINLHNIKEYVDSWSIKNKVNLIKEEKDVIILMTTYSLSNF